MVPIPAAARYSPAGEPRPPAPISRTLALAQLQLALAADVAENDVPAVTLDLLFGEFHVTVSRHS